MGETLDVARVDVCRLSRTTTFHFMAALIAAGLTAGVLGCQPRRTGSSSDTSATPAPPSETSRSDRGAPRTQGASPDPDDPAGDDPVEPPNSKITSVTVFSDRALVTRTAQVQFQSDGTMFEFKKLPGWVDDGSVRVATSDGRIVDVSVKRNYLTRPTDKRFRAAEAALRDLNMQAAELDDEEKILEAQAKQIESIKAYSLEKLSKDTTTLGGSVEGYGKVVEFISTALRDTARARRDAERRRLDLTPAIEARQKKLADLRKLTQLEETTVVVTLDGPHGKTATLDVTYMLPGATWEPTHELRASSAESNAVEVISYAVVVQTSGEDWDNADISFSTQSSVEAVQIPELDALTLGETRSTTRTIKRRVSSYTRAHTAFVAQNELWNMTQSSARHDLARVYQDNFQNLQIVQGKTVQIFNSLRERGTTALFKARDRATVRSDGRSMRLRIGSSSLATKHKIIAAPEESLNAANTLQTTNTSLQPLLPGRVALYRDSAFLGNTDMDFVAEGEDFAVFLNVADHIKLSRTLDKKQSSLVRETHNRMQLAFIVTVENLSSTDTEVSLADRVPVSQNKAIKIDRVKISPAVKPDSKGLLRWDVKLGPKEKKTFQIAYRVEYPPSLTLVTETRRAVSAPDQVNAPAPQAAPLRKKRREKSLEMDIQKWEKRF